MEIVEKGLSEKERFTDELKRRYLNLGKLESSKNRKMQIDEKEKYNVPVPARICSEQEQEIRLKNIHWNSHETFRLFWVFFNANRNNDSIFQIIPVTNFASVQIVYLVYQFFS